MERDFYAQERDWETNFMLNCKIQIENQWGKIIEVEGVVWWGGLLTCVWWWRNERDDDSEVEDGVGKDIVCTDYHKISDAL